MLNAAKQYRTRRGDRIISIRTKHSASLVASDTHPCLATYEDIVTGRLMSQWYTPDGYWCATNSKGGHCLSELDLIEEVRSGSKKLPTV